MKWLLEKRRVYICKCGLVFKRRKRFVEHMNDTNRWRQYHSLINIGKIVKGVNKEQV